MRIPSLSSLVTVRSSDFYSLCLHCLLQWRWGCNSLWVLSALCFTVSSCPALVALCCTVYLCPINISYSVLQRSWPSTCEMSWATRMTLPPWCTTPSTCSATSHRSSALSLLIRYSGSSSTSPVCVAFKLWVVINFLLSKKSILCYLKSLCFACFISLEAKPIVL